MNRGRSNSWLVCAGLGCMLMASGLQAEDATDAWPSFRGAQRDGIATLEVAPWAESGPKEVWRVPIGNGFSGMVIEAGRLYTMFTDGAEEEANGAEAIEYAAAFDADSGKELWRVAVGRNWVDEFGNGPRSTPTIDGDRIYVLGSLGRLMCLAAADGKVHWQVELTEAFAAKPSRWGFSTSVLVDGDLLLVETGGAEGTAYAGLDRKTGNKLWTLGNAQPEHSYSSAIKVELAGKPQFVFTAAEQLTSVDARGTILWSHPWPYAQFTYAVPVFQAPNRFFLSAAGGGASGATLVQVDAKGDGYEVSEVWKSTRFNNHFSSSVLHGGHLYGFHNATLKSVNAADGVQNWAKRGYGKGSLLVAGEHLLILSDRGRLILAAATPEKFAEIASVQALEGKSWTLPTIASGRIYLRNHTEMVSYEIAK